MGHRIPGAGAPDAQPGGKGSVCPQAEPSLWCPIQEFLYLCVFDILGTEMW